jgi:hypothetical protein
MISSTVQLFDSRKNDRGKGTIQSISAPLEWAGRCRSPGKDIGPGAASWSNVCRVIPDGATANDDEARSLVLRFAAVSKGELSSDSPAWIPITDACGGSSMTQSLNS